MKITNIFMILVSIPSFAIAGDSISDFNKSVADMGLSIECQNPGFDFSQKEIQICTKVWRSCQRPDLRPSERRRCVIDAVKSGKAPAASLEGSDNNRLHQSAPWKGRKLNFSLTPMDAYDLIDMCEQSHNKKRGLCTVTVLPSKDIITSDAKSLGVSR